MPGAITEKQLSAALAKTAGDLLGRIDEITDADRAIGDGDHGIGVQRAFEDMKPKLLEGTFEGVDAVFRQVGMSFMGKTGGAAGAIFGTFFLAGGKALAGKREFSGADLADFLRAGKGAVIARGGAAPGNKTIVDVIVPALEAAEAARDLDVLAALQAVARAAEDGKEKTCEMVARFGKAKALGERSLGHPRSRVHNLGLDVRGPCRTRRGGMSETREAEEC